jgi:hypothetical protein
MKKITMKMLFVLAAVMISTAAFAEEASKPAAAPDKPAGEQAGAPASLAAEPAQPAPSVEKKAEPPAVSKPAEKELPISPVPWEGLRAGKVFQFNMELTSLAQWKSNSDFDPTTPYYESRPQNVGLMGTFFKPMFAIKAHNALRFYWESEIGLELWANTNPDVDLADGTGIGGNSYAIGFKQRELYGEAYYKGFGAKAGFQRVIDPSQLFLNCWIGAARLMYDAEKWGVGLMAGQVPGQNYFGWDFQDNSFSFSTIAYAVDGKYAIIDGLRVSAALIWIDDMSIIRHRRQVGAFEASLLYEAKDWHVSAAGAYQLGYLQGMGADGKSTRLSAWGLLAEGAWKSRWVSVEAVATVMSGNGRQDGSDTTAFLYSGRRPGPTTFLSENDLRPLGDNLDIRIGSKNGNFWEMTAGLGGFDAAVWVHPLGWLKVGPVVGWLGVLQPIHALGGNTVAVEAELQMIFSFFKDAFQIQIAGGALIPGKAGAAFVNAIDRTKTDPVGFVQGGLVWRL